MLFKTLIVFILAACIPTITALSEEMEELARQLHNECVGQTGVEEAHIDTVKNQKGFPEDEKFKCYLKCLMTEMAVVDDDGVTDLEAAIAMIPDDLKGKAEPVMRKCGVKTGSSPCDSVYQTHKCYYDTDPKNYMIV